MRRLPLSFSVLLLLALLLASACAPKAPPPPPAPPAPLPEAERPVDKGAAIWREFYTKASNAGFMSGPFRISGTLRYTDDKGETHRVSSLLWGNGKAANPYPLRLDLLAGIGTVAAKVREDANRFLVYIPDEKRAYLAEGEGSTLASFGVPVPLSLGGLTQILTGLPGALFLPEKVQEEPSTPEYTLTGKGARFLIVRAALPGELELSDSGIPLGWKEAGGKGWSITFEPGDKNPLQPQKLRIAHPGGHAALIVVKEIARVSPPYTAEQMGLEIPPGTETKHLEKH